jgi:hypothetical protein
VKAKIDERETDRKIINIRDVFRDINDFKKGYQPRTIIVKMRRVICLQTPTLFWLCGGIISLNLSMYILLAILGKEKNIQQSH